MKVTLNSYTKDATGDRNLLEQIAYVARVSNPSNQNSDDTAEKLVRYLLKNSHWSPLEMVNVCLEIETTRDIARQILRHRSFSFQEFSQRYAVASLGWEYSEPRLQDNKNRQNSFETGDLELQAWWDAKQKFVTEIVSNVYSDALEKGIAKEVSRKVLPEGLTISRLYMNGSLRSWVHYINLRTEKGTQKEHREVALACVEAIKPIFPMMEEFVSK